MSPKLDQLLDLLDLERIEADLFRGRAAITPRHRVYGGQVAGQALVAAGRTVDADRPVHSLHCYFMRPGDAATAIVYDVDRLRDGRSFSTRRVQGIQHGKAIFALEASFHRAEDSFEHSGTAPEVAPPAEALSFEELTARGRGPVESDEEWWGVDFRFLAEPSQHGRPPADRHYHAWLRANGTMPDDPLSHAAVLAYASDMSLLGAVVRPHRRRPLDPEVMTASLDHVMWFHRPVRVDEWLLYQQWSPAAAGARGLAMGRLFTRAGQHVVSVAQEGLVRHLGASAER